ncbi:MAG TPA: hypothetical protein VME20_00300 [Acidimicrobiales bacterium]|nr:hypothetical protein [Acidimicrobiales bacterium]
MPSEQLTSYDLTSQAALPGPPGEDEPRLDGARLGVTGPWRKWREVAVAATLVVILDWPGWTLPRPGLDQSWLAGIADGFVHHMQWGPSLDFTYGPYGFAAVIEPFYRSTSLIAFLYVFAVTWLLAAELVVALGRYWGIGISGFGAWAALTLADAPTHAADFVSLVGLGLALLLLRSPPELRRPLVVLTGALASFAFLVKLNAGLVVAALLVVAVLGAEVSWRRVVRAYAEAASAGVVVFVVCWAAAGQSFTNIVSFATRSVALVLGYSTAMGGRLSPLNTKWWAIALGLVVGLLFYAGLRRWPSRQRAVAAVLVALWGWASTKESFVSGNHWHLFFYLLLCAAVVAGVARPPRAAYLPALAVALCIFLETPALPSAASPLSNVKAFFTEAADIAVPGDSARLASNARARVVAAEPLSPQVLAAVKGRTLAIEPWEDMVAWADPDATWDPEPVVQAYSAYTSSLDQLDAAFIASARAPQRILDYRFAEGFDSRDFFMDPPSTSVAVFCHYDQLAVDGRWQVLERVGDRCGAPVKIGEVSTRFGARVGVPSAPGKMIVASFVFSLPMWSKLADVALKPPFTYLTTFGRYGAPSTFRLVTGTAADEHVLRAPGLGYAKAFTPPDVRALELSGAGWRRGQGDLKVVFYAIALRR